MMLAPPCIGADTHDTREYPSEMTLIRKAAKANDFNQWRRRSYQELSCHFDSHHQEPSMRWSAGRRLECPRKMTDRQLARLGDTPQRRMFRQICSQHFHRATQLPRRQTGPRCHSTGFWGPERACHVGQSLRCPALGEHRKHFVGFRQFSRQFVECPPKRILGKADNRLGQRLLRTW
jgi:hypothetical protein